MKTIVCPLFLWFVFAQNCFWVYIYLYGAINFTLVLENGALRALSLIIIFINFRSKWRKKQWLYLDIFLSTLWPKKNIRHFDQFFLLLLLLSSLHFKSFYLDLRKRHHSQDSTPITTRQLESLIRLTEARARLELREVSTAQDAEEVVEIMKYRYSCFMWTWSCCCSIHQLITGYQLVSAVGHLTCAFPRVRIVCVTI